MKTLGRLAALLIVSVLLFASCLGAMIDSVNSPGPASASQSITPSANALADIPADYLALLEKWGKFYHVQWNLGAAITRVETTFGKAKLPGVTSGINDFGCCRGPNQFNTKDGDGPVTQVSGPNCPEFTYRRTSTWGLFKTDGNNDGVECIFDPEDSIPAMFKKLAAQGATTRDGWTKAVLRYNNSSAYLARVISLAESYASAFTAAASTPGTVGSVKLLTPLNIGFPGANGYYTMPPSLDGALHIYSCPAHRTGSLELISVLHTVAQAWKALHPSGWIYLGDMNAAGHKSHKWGVAADLEATTNGSDWVADYTKGNYNQAATIELGKLFVDTGKIKEIWYDDATVDDAVVAYARSKNLPLSQMKPIGNHDDHFHMNVTTPYGPVYEPGC